MMKQHIKQGLGAFAFIAYLLFYSCASIGSPDGGPYDETPPVLLRTTPEQNALNNQVKKVVIEFDEYIKLEKASEKVAISPPQLEQPDVRTSGKKVIVELFDTLKEETTYTIDFADAILDNNEGNAFGDFCFQFSTGEKMDTMQVSGTVLEAETLEPVQGMLVGLHINQADSAFTTLPFDRVGRTDANGKFTIRGVAPGEYRIYALQDANQNYIFDQKSEKIAFNDELVVPASFWDMRYDTIWRDTLTWDSIREVHYTHFLPDTILLKAFTETPITQYLAKTERLTPTKFSLYFAVGADSLPKIAGLNFDATDAFLIEHSAARDSVHYWIKDSTVFNLDTLEIALTYLFTDTTSMLVPRTDTLELSPKTTWEMIHKEIEKKQDEWIKAQKKKQKKGDTLAIIDTVMPQEALKTNIVAAPQFDISKNVHFQFDEPLARMNQTLIHLWHQVDSAAWEELPFIIEEDTLTHRSYTLFAEWRPEESYRLEADSLAFEGLYGKVSKFTDTSFKVKSLDEYSALFMVITNPPPFAVAQLLNSSDKVVQQAQVVNGKADFFFVTPGKYFVRLINDRNGNGKWDTGLYEEHLQAEEIFYYPMELDLKAMWEIEQTWTLNQAAASHKPDALTKKKNESAKKTAHDRNVERLAEKNKK